MKRTAFVFFLSIFIAILSLNCIAENQYKVPADSYKLSDPKKTDMNTWEKVEAAENEPPGWWPILQIVLLPNVPSYVSKNLYGLRFGPFYSGGSGCVYGMEFSPFVACSDYVEGIQMSFIKNDSLQFYGFRMSTVNISREKSSGFQMAIANLNKDKAEGFDLGFINNTKNEMAGLQMGMANLATRPKFQIGIINYAMDYGIQIGGFNIIQNGWLPFFPGINFNF
ncbi:MAG TPA: hypothetical protein DD381_10320 [Lentisphaeria bacterium]|nr:MAG: hypothetical protein A2X47_13895 [Lentisphaerae bacterium GWF2_38_69]HBM16720.1 hypothetical protein [Lentisphaeria bacterium]